MKKKPSRHFFRLLIFLFLIFIALFIALKSGYYESNLGKRKELTAEKIKEFERDVQEGKEVDIKNYLETNSKDYSNKISKLGMSLGSSTEKFMTSGIEQIFKFLGVLFS